MGRCAECFTQGPYCRACVRELEAEKADLTAKLAGAMGALEKIETRTCMVGYHSGDVDCHRIATEALADEPPASKRYRAIVAAAEALEAFASETPEPRKAEDVEMNRMKEFARLLSALYEAVRGEGE